MIDGKLYVQKVKEYYSFLINEFRLSIINETVNGSAFYDVHYGDQTKAISISYENIEDYFQVTIFKLQNGQMPDYDDKTKTLHLNTLNAIILSQTDRNEIELNSTQFDKFQANNDIERKLLKSANELRLCLKHFNEI
jgi:hypothetical protein